MVVLDWIVNNILTQASIIIGLIACLGLALQRKPGNEIFAGTMKTLFGFMILSAGSSVPRARFPTLVTSSTQPSTSVAAARQSSHRLRASTVRP